MGSRSRIRWHKVAKLSLGVLGCLALFVGLPSLIWRPEPPPLEPDIGLGQLAASREPAPLDSQPERGAAKAATERARDRARRGSREGRQGLSLESPRPVAARRSTRGEGGSPS